MMVPSPPASPGDGSKNTLAVAIVHPVKHRIKPINDTSTRVTFFMCAPTATLEIPKGFDIPTLVHIATAGQTQHGRLFV
jgi:hypothetical protein